MTGRLRQQRIAMQRSIEELVEAREQARGEAIRCRRVGAVTTAAVRRAHERVDPSVHRLRQRL